LKIQLKGLDARLGHRTGCGISMRFMLLTEWRIWDQCDYFIAEAEVGLKSEFVLLQHRQIAPMPLFKHITHT